MHHFMTFKLHPCCHGVAEAVRVQLISLCNCPWLRTVQVKPEAVNFQVFCNWFAEMAARHTRLCLICWRNISTLHVIRQWKAISETFNLLRPQSAWNIAECQSHVGSQFHKKWHGILPCFRHIQAIKGPKVVQICFETVTGANVRLSHTCIERGGNCRCNNNTTVTCIIWRQKIQLIGYSTGTTSSTWMPDTMTVPEWYKLAQVILYYMCETVANAFDVVIVTCV